MSWKNHEPHALQWEKKYLGTGGKSLQQLPDISSLEYCVAGFPGENTGDFETLDASERNRFDTAFTLFSFKKSSLCRWRSVSERIWWDQFDRLPLAEPGERKEERSLTRFRAKDGKFLCETDLRKRCFSLKRPSLNLTGLFSEAQISASRMSNNIRWMPC